MASVHGRAGALVRIDRRQRAAVLPETAQRVSVAEAAQRVGGLNRCVTF